MPEQMWEDREETSAVEAAKAEMKRKREVAAAQAAQADEDPQKTREWEALKGKNASRPD